MSARNLRRMKLIFEETRQSEFWPQLVAKIPWGHTSLIFEKVKDPDQRTFYLQMCGERGWSRSILEEEILFDAYSKRLQFQNNFSVALKESHLSTYRLEFKDEYNLYFLGLEDTR